MAIDTLGSVFGSLITTLVLMPIIGVSATVFALVLLTSFAIILQARKSEKRHAILLWTGIICASFLMDIYLPAKTSYFLIKDDTISRLEIIPTDNNQSKIMMINGQYASKRSSEENQFDYTRFINKQLKTLDKNKKHSILVLGAAGFSIGIDDNQNEYTFLDIEPKLKEISEKHFLEKPLGKNKKLIVQDAYFYMLKNEKKYDVIILDVYSSKKDIPINFVTVEFFNMIKKSLNPSGYMMANIITSPSFENTFSKRIDNTLKAVFSSNLSRQIVSDFKLDSKELVNVVYFYHNLPEDKTIYTFDKNSAMYGQF